MTSPLDFSNLPNDADADVLRKLHARGFNFGKEHVVDFNIDFDLWPPPDSAVDAIKSAFPKAVVTKEEDEEIGGYLLIQFKSLVSYSFVVDVQQTATALVSDYGGRCESWGVLH